MFILITALPLAVLCAYGMATRFRVLGRHATPLLPLIFLLLGLGLVRAAYSPRWWGKIFAGIFLLAWPGSSVLIRFEPRHKRTTTVKWSRWRNQPSRLARVSGGMPTPRALLIMDCRLMSCAWRIQTQSTLQRLFPPGHCDHLQVGYL